MSRRVLAFLVNVLVIMSMAGPARATEESQEVTEFSTRETVSAIQGTTSAGCRTVSRGYGYRNAFGSLFAYIRGTLYWCWRSGRVTSGNLTVYIQRCCYWFYEGIVHRQDLGCFSGCSYVQKHRRGSFIYNPPWPAITTRVQPWFTLRGGGWGGWYSASGG